MAVENTSPTVVRHECLGQEKETVHPEDILAEGSCRNNEAWLKELIHNHVAGEEAVPNELFVLDHCNLPDKLNSLLLTVRHNLAAVVCSLEEDTPLEADLELADQVEDFSLAAESLRINQHDRRQLQKRRNSRLGRVPPCCPG